MVMELHVWGPAFGLPSIDAECLATVAYFHRIVPHSQWTLIADHDTSISPRDEFPLLIDGAFRATGFASIVSYLRNHHSGAYDLDYHLNHRQQTNRTAFISFLQSTAAPLIDLSLYISSENYNAITSAAYTAILPWYLNYTIPPARRDLARARTTHLGLNSLDVSAAEDDGGFGPGSEFGAAKRSAGIPGDSSSAQPKVLSMGRSKGLQGLLSSPVYAARFKLDALTNELLEPILDLLGKKDYLLDGGRPSSLDCLAFGYLALMFYPATPQAWLKESIQSRFPRISRYISRMREELLGGEDVKAADIWSISSCREDEVEETIHKLHLRLPWRPLPRRSLYSTVTTASRELSSQIPLLSNIGPQETIIQADHSRQQKKVPSSLPSRQTVGSLVTLCTTMTAFLAGLAIQHRRSPREGDLIFWALRPGLGVQGFGEAGNFLSVLASQLPQAPLAGL